jgi:hypothetical protein
VERAVEAEAAPVIPAAQLLQVAGALDDERPAVGAHVREAVEAVLRISCEHERLVERARQEREREHLARDAHQIVVTRVLPRPREDALPLEPEQPGVRVHPRRQRRGDPDVRIDLERSVAHRGDATAHRDAPLG